MTAELAEAEPAAAVVVAADAPPPAAAADAINLATPSAAADAAPGPDSELSPASAVAPAVAEPSLAAAEENSGEKGADAAIVTGNAVADADAADAPPPALDPNLDASAGPKRAKKKFALFVAYVGAGFSGMQYNKDQETIEGTLRDALVSAGLISQQNADAFSKVAWSRAARTDKGVSAVGQVVAARLLVPTEEEGGENTIAALANAKLPAAIRVLGASKVRNGFDARKSCDRRRYEYVLPEFAFDPTVCCARADERSKKVAAKEGGEGEEGAEKEAKAPEGEKEAAPAAPATETETAAPAPAKEEKEEEEKAPKAPFVFDDAARDKLNSILAQYEGTHNFHNFTVRVAHTDPAATRYIVSFRCDGVSVLPDGQRWVRLVVFGQSFILHQIRKMVGTALAVFRGAAPDDAIASALRKEGDVATPMAPELGLFLAETVYSHYNATWAGDNGREDDDDDDDDEDDEGEGEEGGTGEGGDGKNADDASEKIDPALREQHREYLEQQARLSRQQKKQKKGKRECLSLGAWGDAAEKFKLEFVYPHIARVDAERKTNEEWLRSLNDRNFHFSSWSGAGRRGPHPGGARGKRKAQMVGGVFDGPSAGGEGMIQKQQRNKGDGGDRAQQRSGGRGRGNNGNNGCRGGRGGRGGASFNKPASAAAPPPTRSAAASKTGYDDASMAAEWSD